MQPDSSLQTNSRHKRKLDSNDVNMAKKPMPDKTLTLGTVSDWRRQFENGGKQPVSDPVFRDVKKMTERDFVNDAKSNGKRKKAPTESQTATCDNTVTPTQNQYQPHKFPTFQELVSWDTHLKYGKDIGGEWIWKRAVRETQKAILRAHENTRDYLKDIAETKSIQSKFIRMRYKSLFETIEKTMTRSSRVSPVIKKPPTLETRQNNETPSKEQTGEPTNLPRLDDNVDVKKVFDLVHDTNPQEIFDMVCDVRAIIKFTSLRSETIQKKILNQKNLLTVPHETLSMAIRLMALGVTPYQIQLFRNWYSDRYTDHNANRHRVATHAEVMKVFNCYAQHPPVDRETSDFEITAFWKIQHSNHENALTPMAYNYEGELENLVRKRMAAWCQEQEDKPIISTKEKKAILVKQLNVRKKDSHSIVWRHETDFARLVLANEPDTHTYVPYIQIDRLVPYRVVLYKGAYFVSPRMPSSFQLPSNILNELSQLIRGLSSSTSIVQQRKFLGHPPPELREPLPNSGITWLKDAEHPVVQMDEKVFRNHIDGHTGSIHLFRIRAKCSFENADNALAEYLAAEKKVKELAIHDAKVKERYWKKISNVSRVEWKAVPSDKYTYARHANPRGLWTEFWDWQGYKFDASGLFIPPSLLVHRLCDHHTTDEYKHPAPDSSASITAQPPSMFIPIFKFNELDKPSSYSRVSTLPGYSRVRGETEPKDTLPTWPTCECKLPASTYSNPIIGSFLDEKQGGTTMGTARAMTMVESGVMKTPLRQKGHLLDRIHDFKPFDTRIADEIMLNVNDFTESLVDLIMDYVDGSRDAPVRSPQVGYCYYTFRLVVL